MVGVVLWLAAGLVIAVAGRLLLPGPAAPWGLMIVVGAAGGLAGGLLATLLDMGGIAELDLRAGVLALLAAMLSVLLVQLVRIWRT